MVSHDFQIRTLFSTCKLKPLDFVSFNPEQMKATIPYAEALLNKYKEVATYCLGQIKAIQDNETE